MSLTISLSLILIYFSGTAWSHARLMYPPSRSSMWRLGYPTPINFNDNELYCGGLTIQWQKNGGKCGICGDPYHMPHPRANEAGGKYGLGIISERYLSGQVIDVTVDVTTNHRGYFEFKLCANNNPKKEATQDCLDENVLKEAHGFGTRYYVGDKVKGKIILHLQLPKDLTCSQCVLQWTYVAGNNWGKCKDGKSGMGCGPQETFRGCADIAIHKDTDVKPNEIDIENDNNQISGYKSKNNELSKEKTNAKFITYAYEITKQARQNSPTSNLVVNHNISNPDSHANIQIEENNILSRTFNKSLVSKEEGHHSTEHRPRASTSRRKYKNGNKNSYQFKNLNPFLRKNPFDQNWDVLMNNNRWPLSFGELKSKNLKNLFKKKRGSQSSRFRSPGLYFKHINPPLMVFSDSEEDAGMSETFDFGGRRYADFWLL